MTQIKKHIVLLLWIVIPLSAFSQGNILNKKIDISFTKLPFAEALAAIEKEANCKITYRLSESPQGSFVTKSFKNTELRSIIVDIWGGKQLNFLTIDNEINIQVVPEKKANNQKGKLEGRITDDKDEPLSGVTVQLAGTTTGRITDADGRFSFQTLQAGVYKLIISSMGFEQKELPIKIRADKTTAFTTKLNVSTSELEEVVVVGETESKTTSEGAITISSLDIKQVQDQALGTEEVLKTTTGLVLRQNGGLGSTMSINLNGLTGNAVRTYYDGIPLELYGNGLRLNTIPVDALERVDVYKGVMTIDMGTDALGGGLNLVPVQQSDDYLRTSYSFGSFNTHRFTFNGLKKLSDRTSLSTISYFNYSDNDYRMRDIPNLVVTELPDGSPGFEEERITARRFHDRHISGFIEGKLRIRDLKWADRLEFALAYSKTADEIQNLGAIINTAIGDVEREIEVFSPRIDYRKSFFKDRLSARYFGVLSHTVDNIVDTTANVFNWKGEILNIRGGGASLLERENVGTAHRLTLTYKITDHIDVKVSDYYRYTRQKGEDPLGERIPVEGEPTDPNTFPSTLNRNIFGVELNATFLEDKLNAIAFFKNYLYQAEAIDIFRVGEGLLEFSEIQKNRNGYGFALKYQLHPTVFIRTSVERAIRIPEETEIFGDLAATIPNFDLEPEESLNWNVGAQFEKRFKNDRSILVNLNGFIRNRENLIRPKLFFNLIQFINEAVVDGKGIELALKISPIKNLSLQGNFTGQSNEIASGIDIGKQVPNIPLTFYNVGANYRIEDLFKPGNSLQLSWTYLFIDRFSINTVTDLNTANPDFIVPEQFVHNAGLTYKLKEQGLAFSFNLQNVFNAEIFDNFRIPRPGINYAFKINYSL